jgi:hypothetical protein
MNNQIYYNTLVPVPVTILNGSKISVQINCGSLLNGSGAGAFRRIKLPAFFPSGSITFNVDSDNAPHTISDGTTTQNFSLVANGGLQSITFPAIYFDSITLFQVVSSVSMPSDLILTLYFQPIYQGTA